MNDSKQPLPPHIQAIVRQLDEQINTQKQLLQHLEKSRQMWIDSAPNPTILIQKNKPLTRDYIRSFLSGYKQPVQTTQVIDMLYTDKTEEERYNLVKHLSVMFNQMADKGELSIEKREGVKGNFYTWKG